MAEQYWATMFNTYQPTMERTQYSQEMKRRKWEKVRRIGEALRPGPEAAKISRKRRREGWHILPEYSAGHDLAATGYRVLRIDAEDQRGGREFLFFAGLRLLGRCE